jgi:Putative zinc-finger
MTDGHLDPTMLAEYDEGLLPPPQADEVENHLAECDSCAAVLGQLGQVRARLADLPAEITMPATVAARIDDALALERAHVDREVPPARVATMHPLRRRLPQLLAAAATIVAVAFAGYVVSMSGGGDDSAESTTSAQGGAEAGDDDADGAAGGSLEDKSTQREAVPDRLLPAPAERAILAEQIRTIVSADLASGDDSAPQRVAHDCGLVLARQLDTELIGVATTDIGQPAAVLVVVAADLPGVAQGFVLPGCSAGVAEALRELTVPIE